MKQVSIGSYGNYSSDNYGANCMQVGIGSLDLYFSYQTVVAFRTPKTGFVISENCWGPTTGKHLNWLNDDKKNRLNRGEFEKQLEKVLKAHKLSV